MSILESFLPTTSPSINFNLLSSIAHSLGRGQYSGHSGEGEKKSYSSEEAVNAISGNKKWYFSFNNPNHELSYSFKTKVSSNEKFHTRDFHELSGSNKIDVRDALKSWSDIANINFIEVPDSVESNIRFSGYDGNSDAGEQGQTFTSSLFGSLLRSEVFLNLNNSETSFELGGYGRLTLVHEIGHALGLDHPSKYDASTTDISYSDSANYREDTLGYSVMSYWDEINSAQQFRTDDELYNGVRYYPHTPQLDDIASIIYLYGPNLATRADDTVYGYNSNAGLSYKIEHSSNTPPIFSIWDGGGNDTLDFSEYDGDQIISLTSGTHSSTNGYLGNISIAGGVTIENAIGGSGDDIIIGNLSPQKNIEGFLNTHNTIHGGGGNDLILGGLGSDNLWGDGGNNTFLYSSVTESPSSDPDIIFDFKTGIDKIDLSGMDELLDIGGLQLVSNFRGIKGDTYIAHDEKTGASLLSIDFSGSGEADFSIILVGQLTPHDLVV